LNNPLSVVVGHALMLREETTDPDALRRIGKIGQAAERCAGIVKSFLAMARQEPAVLAPVGLDTVVSSAVDAFEQGPDGQCLEIEVALPDDLPPILADADQVAQVLINLLTNAAQAIAGAGKGGRTRVSARHDRHARMVEIRIADDGPGVPAEVRGRIFDPLFTTKDVGQGTGIGLAFCHRVAASHGGLIRLDAGSAEGATFVLRLPVARGETEAGAGAETGAAPVVRGRLLVVEDEEDVAELIREILGRDGFDVDHAVSGEAGLEMIATRRYALILADLNMPGMGGRGFFAALNRDQPELAANLGFVTGDTMSPSARSFLDAARRPCLEKPIAPAELRAMVRRMVAERHERKEAQDG
jgi:CheY-like chemotaxis protein